MGTNSKEKDRAVLTKPKLIVYISSSPGLTPNPKIALRAKKKKNNPQGPTKENNKIHIIVHLKYSYI